MSTRDSSFEKASRRDAPQPGQPHVEAVAGIDDLTEDRFITPSAASVLSHLRNRYGLGATGATKVSQHNNHVFHIELGDGAPWIARVYPPARPAASVEGEAAILRFLQRHDYPAERLAVDDAISELDGASVLVTEFVESRPLPAGPDKMAILGDMLGRLHALELDESVSRSGGAAGDDPNHEGSPKQDRAAALSFLAAVDTEVAPEGRELLDQLREQVRSADSGEGLPQTLVHGNLLHNPDHVLLAETGPLAINWRTAGRGPRLSDLAYLVWGAEWAGGKGVQAAVDAYSHHIELTDDEIGRLEAVMYLRPLYLACFDFRRSVANGEQPTGNEWWWGLIDPAHINANAAAARTALGW